MTLQFRLLKHPSEATRPRGLARRVAGDLSINDVDQHADQHADQHVDQHGGDHEYIFWRLQDLQLAA